MLGTESTRYPLRCRVLPTATVNGVSVDVMLDSNVFDELLADADAFAAVADALDAGYLRVLVTHVQRDQLAATPDDDKRRRLLTVAALVDPMDVYTAGFIVDVSTVDEGALDMNSDLIEAIRPPPSNERHDRDALIAVTAHHYRAILVTGDGRLVRRCRNVGVASCSLSELLTVVSTG